MSGSATAPYIEPLKNPQNQAMKQAEVLGVLATNSKDLVAQLRLVSAATLVNSSDEMKVTGRNFLLKVYCEIEIGRLVLVCRPIDIIPIGDRAQ